MEFSFLGFGLSTGLTFLLLITAIALLIVATVYLKTTSGNGVTSTMANNNTKALYLFIGALIALGLFIILNGFMTFNVFTRPTKQGENVQKEDIDEYEFGFGSYFLLSINVILMIAAIALIFVGYSYVDPATNNTHGELIKTLALSSGIITAILLFPLIYMFIDVTKYNQFLTKKPATIIDTFDFQPYNPKCCLPDIRLGKNNEFIY